MQTKEWHAIPTEALKAAREQLSWSYEGAARALGVSSKTYERYEKAGRIPLDLVGNVIHTLNLDIEHPASARLRLVADQLGGADVPTTSEVLVVIRRTAEVVEQLTVALRLLSDRFPDDAPAAPLSSGEVAQPS